MGCLLFFLMFFLSEHSASMGEQEKKKRVSFSMEPDDVALLPPVTLAIMGTPLNAGNQVKGCNVSQQYLAISLANPVEDVPQQYTVDDRQTTSNNDNTSCNINYEDNSYSNIANWSHPYDRNDDQTRRIVPTGRYKSGKGGKGNNRSGYQYQTSFNNPTVNMRSNQYNNVHHNQGHNGGNDLQRKLNDFSTTNQIGGQSSTWTSTDGSDRGAAVRWLTAVTTS